MIFLKIFYGLIIWKNTNGKKPLVTRFRHWPAGFRSVSPESGTVQLDYGRIGQIPAPAGIQPVPPNSGNWIPKFEDLREYIRVTNKLQCPAMTDSHKRSCKNKKFISKKLIIENFKIVEICLFLVCPHFGINHHIPALAGF